MEKRRQRILMLLAVLTIILIMCIVFHKPPRLETMDSMQKVDVVYYINLEKRADRKDQFLQEMAKIGFPAEKIIRIDAVEMPGRGDVGCSKSHVKAMQHFVNSSKQIQNCIIFEDDFEFTESPDKVSNAFATFFNYEIPYDVCMISAYEVDTSESGYSILHRVMDAQTASGYMVNRKFAPTLLENFKEGAQLLEESYDTGKPNPSSYAVDQYWKSLQPNANWFMFYPKLGKQRGSFSNIEGKYMDYDA